MLLDMLKAVHVLLGVATLSTGITACIRIVSGHPFTSWAARFLQASLAAGAAGILISIFHPDPMRWVAVLGVYVSAIAVMAWRRRDRPATSVDPFVLSTMAVFCLDCLILAAHLFRLAAAPGSRTGPTPMEAVADAIVILFFAVMSGISLRSVHHHLRPRLAP